MVPFSSIIFIWSIFLVAYVQSTVRRAIGGKPTDIEHFPYQVSLQMDGQPICGGAIVGKRFILTVAHCTVDWQGELRSSGFSIIAGITDLNNSTEDLSVEVGKIYIPRSYNPIDFSDDIAVLELEKDLDLSRGLRVLELPTNNQTYVGQVAKIAGYGWNRLQNWAHGGTDDILRYLNVTIISNDECRRQHSAFKYVAQFNDSVICGKALPQHAGNSAGVCKGDSGSPLVIGNTVIGVASLAGSFNCTEDKFAAIYSRISNFLVFVNNVLSGFITDGIELFDLTADAEASDDYFDIYDSYDKK